jgi:chaperonin GroEL
VAYLRCLPALKGIKVAEGSDEQWGIDVVSKALEHPARRIAENAGWEGAVVISKIMEGKGAFGFNAATEVYEDLDKAGVIDPTKVSRSALQNAASVASLLLTTEALITEIPDRKKAQPQGGGGGGGYGGEDF